MNSGAIGGKVVGAGGGGFILFVAKEDKRKELIHTMTEAGMRFMDFRFDFDGVKIMTNI
jgi:D-glycero-alpha-D-manno-heptose-7-phosphate kinase